MSRIILSITQEQGKDLKAHLEMNNYSVEWVTNSVINVSEEEIDYVKTILFDRDISFVDADELHAKFKTFYELACEILAMGNAEDGYTDEEHEMFEETANIVNRYEELFGKENITQTSVVECRFSNFMPAPMGKALDEYFEKNGWKLEMRKDGEKSGYQVFFGKGVQVDNYYEYAFPCLLEEKDMIAFAKDFYENNFHVPCKETYSELQERHQQEFNAFPVRYAFSKEQFQEMMKSWGLKEKDTKKIVSVGCGGFILESDRKAYVEMVARHNIEHQEAILADTTGENYIFQMFYVEMCNHEFGYTWELDDTLTALGLTMNEIESNPALKRGLEKATARFSGM